LVVEIAYREHGPLSHWRGIANFAKTRPATLRLADFLGRGRGRLRVLDDWYPPVAAPYVPDLSGWENHKLAAAWIGHATVLLRAGGMTILTDPVMRNRVGLGLGVITGGPRRLVAPALNIRSLPKLDLILLSHAHFDHLDRPTLVRLNKHVPVITAHHTRDLVRDLGFRKVTELRWGERKTIGPATISAQEVRHWGARTFYDQHRGFNAYLIEAGGQRILYGGDTAYGEHFKDIGNVDLAVLGIGAYDPYVAAHATPEQAYAMANHVRAERMLAMHHSTFRLSYEPDGEPMERLLTAAGRDAERIVARHIGQTFFSN
jgi:L-ascorbate metabolism protein UlaG (beta-lactamase superfamily)